MPKPVVGVTMKREGTKRGLTRGEAQPFHNRDVERLLSSLVAHERLDTEDRVALLLYHESLTLQTWTDFP